MPRGDWMQTYTGRAFYPLDPRPEDIDIIDIAHALSMTCRYGGHVTRFYSVAEHCVLMAETLPQEDALWALLHDAAEAYIGDMIAPLKRSLPEFKSVEARIMRAVIEKFGLPEAKPDRIVRADRRILHDERAALLTPPPQPWSPDLEALPPLGVKIHAWSPPEAEARFLATFDAVTTRWS